MNSKRKVVIVEVRVTSTKIDDPREAVIELRGRPIIRKITCLKTAYIAL